MTPNPEVGSIRPGDIVQMVCAGLKAALQQGLSENLVNEIADCELYYNAIPVGSLLKIVVIYKMSSRSLWAVAQILDGERAGEYGDFVLDALRLYDPDGNY